MPTAGPIRSTPAIAEDTVFVGSGDGGLHALALGSGAQLWRAELGAPVRGSPAVHGGAVFVTDAHGTLHSVQRATGLPIWRTQTGPAMPFPWGHESGDLLFASPVVANDVVYWGAADGVVYAVDATRGDVLWQYATEGAQLVSAEWGFDRRTIQSPPVVVDGTVFIGARNGFLYALDAQSGAPRWRVDHEISWINGMPAVADGVLYTGTSDGRFFQAVDVATGEERWRKPTALGEERLSVRLPTRILASPVLSSGMLLVGGLDGAVYAVRLDATQPLRRAVFHDTAYARAARYAGGSQLTEFLTAAGLALHGASHRSGAVGPAAPFRGRSCAGIVEETFPSQKPSPDVTVRVYVACLLCVALTLPGLPAHAQTRPPVHLEIFETTMPEAAPSAPWTGRVLTALGGAALGAGIGFFASQVVRGDWEDGSGLDRPVWAAVGGSIGFAVGFSFPIAGRGTRPDPSRGLPSGRFVIRADELRGTGVKTAAEAVELLRPEWLRGRGTHILGERADETIQVYLDDVHLGGLRFLGDVPATTVRAIHFFDAAAATLRWGAGHSHGVILIVAEGGMPSRGGS